VAGECNWVQNTGGPKLTCKTLTIGEKPVPVSLYLPKIPHGLAWGISAVSRRLTVWASTWPPLQKPRAVSHWSHSWNVWDRNISIVYALATGLKPIHVLPKMYSGCRNRSVKLIAQVRLRFAVRTFSFYLRDECIRCVGVMQHCGWLRASIICNCMGYRGVEAFHVYDQYVILTVHFHDWYCYGYYSSI
jgi:hypothetical protein